MICDDVKQLPDVPAADCLLLIAMSGGRGHQLCAVAAADGPPGPRRLVGAAPRYGGAAAAAAAVMEGWTAP